MIKFQLFAENPLHIDGIDDDIAAMLQDEYNEISPQEAETEEPQVEENADTQVNTEVEETEQEAPADADSDNKQVADNVPGNIPYARFKQQNDKLKQAEQELAELRARLSQQSQQQVAPQPQLQQVPTQQPPAESNDFNEQEVMRAVTSEAISRAKTKLGLTDDDVANLEFSDSIEDKIRFQVMVQRESNAILEQARRNADMRTAKENEQRQTVQAFNDFVTEFQTQPDADVRWNYIAEERFLQLPAFEQATIRGAFERLQRNEASPTDFFLAKRYFDSANAEYTEKKSVGQSSINATPKQNINRATEKLKQAQAMPKAPNVQGSVSTPGMSVDDIAELMNKPGNEGIDKIPKELWDKILRGEPIA